MGKYREAEDALLTFVAGNPADRVAAGGATDSITQAAKNPEAFNELGLLYIDMGRYAEAVEQFQRAVDYAPKDAKGLTAAANGTYERNLRRAQDAVAQAGE